MEGNNVEQFLTRDKDGTIRKYEIAFDYDARDPRDPEQFTNLGKMVFKKNRNGSYGDEQCESFSEFMKKELDTPCEDYIRGNFSFKLPTLSEAKNNPNLGIFAAGTKENGEHFDVALFNQSMDDTLEQIKQQLGTDGIDEITGGIPLDENQHLTDVYEVEFSLSWTESEIDSEEKLDAFKKSFKSIMEESYGISIDTENIDWTHREPCEEELYEIWEEKNVCVVPINLYVHSGSSVHPTGIGFNRYGELDCDGLIFVKKDSQEVLDQKRGFSESEGKKYSEHEPRSDEYIKEWAESVCRSEIETYDNWLTGQCFMVNRAVYDPVNREFNDNWTGGFYGTGAGSSYNGYMNMCRDEGMSESEEVFDFRREAELLKSVDTDDFVKGLFFTEAKKQLPDYNNNPELAFVTQLKLWENSPDKDRAMRIKEMMGKYRDKKDFIFELVKNMDVEINPANLHLVASNILPEKDISNHESDLYLAKSEKSDWLKGQMEKKYGKLMNQKSNPLFSTFTDQVTGKPSYEFAFCWSPEVAARSRKQASQNEWDKSRKSKSDGGMTR